MIRYLLLHLTLLHAFLHALVMFSFVLAICLQCIYLDKTTAMRTWCAFTLCVCDECEFPLANVCFTA